jgi:hypothetical protein
MTNETANKGLAIAAVASPWWLPALQKVSEVATFALPILGVLWIILQASIAIAKYRRGK